MSFSLNSLERLVYFTRSLWRRTLWFFERFLCSSDLSGLERILLASFWPIPIVMNTWNILQKFAKMGDCCSTRIAGWKWTGQGVVGKQNDFIDLKRSFLKSTNQNPVWVNQIWKSVDWKLRGKFGDNSNGDSPSKRLKNRCTKCTFRSN